MNIDLLNCKNCNQHPVREIHGVSYIIICKPCNVKSKTAVMYDKDKVNQIYNEWNEIQKSQSN